MQKPISVAIDTKNDDARCLYENIRKGDTLLMTIKIFQDSASLNLTGQTMHIVLKKPDGYSVEKIASGVTGNTFQVAFDVQATLAIGDVEGIVEISDSNGTNITNVFSFEVKENPSSNIITQSSNQIETLSQIVALINSYNANADNLATQNTLAIQNIATLEGDISTAQATDTTLKSDISTGQVLDATLKSDISNGNTIHSNLLNDISTGNILYLNLDTAIANGNATIEGLKDVNIDTIKSYISLMDAILNGTRLTDENGNYLTDESGNYLTL